VVIFNPCYLYYQEAERYLLWQRQTAGWRHPSAMAVRPGRGLGWCHGSNHVGRFLPPSFFCECSSCSSESETV